MSDQLTFARLIAEADELAHLALDRRRDRMQTWFDDMPVAQKGRLAEWLTAFDIRHHVASGARFSLFSNAEVVAP